MAFEAAPFTTALLSPQAFAVSFNMEKVALLRFTRQPPIMDSSLARLSLRLLPLALVLHLAVTVVTFNEPSLLESRSAFDRLSEVDPSASVSSWYSSAVDEDSSDALVSFAARLQREAVIIPLFLLALFLVVWIIRLVIGNAFRACITNCLVVLCCGRPCVDTRVVDEFKSNPPFTGLYAQPLARGVKHTLGEAEEEEGFRIERDRNVRGDRTAQRKIKVWTESGVTYGKVHEAGERMMTWETIADVGIASYDPTANPEYAEAFMAMAKAVSRTEKQMDLMRTMIQMRARAAAARASAHSAMDKEGHDGYAEHDGYDEGDGDDEAGLEDGTGINADWDVPDDESVASSVGNGSRSNRMVFLNGDDDSTGKQGEIEDATTRPDSRHEEGEEKVGNPPRSPDAPTAWGTPR